VEIGGKNRCGGHTPPPTLPYEAAFHRKVGAKNLC
jgi:hypothetical protein